MTQDGYGHEIASGLTPEAEDALIAKLASIRSQRLDWVGGYPDEIDVVCDRIVIATLDDANDQRPVLLVLSWKEASTEVTRWEDDNADRFTWNQEKSEYEVLATT